jgi:hypothetical protein
MSTPNTRAANHLPNPFQVAERCAEFNVVVARFGGQKSMLAFLEEIGRALERC